MKQIGHLITGVVPGSIAEELGLEPGDRIVSIGDTPVRDVFDYRYLCEDEFLTVQVLTKDGEDVTLEIEKDEDEDLGLIFESGLMSDYRSCHNKCLFCFIDQMPPGMRDTLYFKDDDTRLSFLQGNYVTMTNLSDDDISRIIRYRMSPINISVHATDPELRARLLHNRFAGKILDQMRRLADAEIEMNGQIVLCPGYNDREQLDRTIGDLAQFLPHMQSLSVVPVGLTKFREGLCALRPVEKEDALDTIARIEAWQKKLYPKYGLHFVHASDELYITAGLPLPEEERYDGYLQLENGVGMLRLFLNEAQERLAGETGDREPRHFAMASGILAAPYLEQVLALVREKFPGTDAAVYPIRNDFFGEKITVSGLVTGQDLIAQLAGKDLGCALLIPANMLKSDAPVFLDDVTVGQVEDALGVRLHVVGTGGGDLVEAMLRPDDIPEDILRMPVYDPYELPSINNASETDAGETE